MRVNAMLGVPEHSQRHISHGDDDDAVSGCV